MIPSTPDGDQYYLATWTGISGDRFYKNAPGADFTTWADAWVTEHIRSKGPLGKLYPFPCCIHEGDTPAFLGLINNGLASFMSPAYGGWGGRYVWRQYYGETHPIWTQGGDSFPGRDNSKDTVIGTDGNTYTSDHATIWRWRTAFQHDFAARMDWTVKGVRDANHNPVVVVNSQPGKAPVTVAAVVGVPIVPRRNWNARSRRSHAEVHVVLLPRGGYWDPGPSGCRAWPSAWWGGGPRRHSVSARRRAAGSSCSRHRRAGN